MSALAGIVDVIDCIDMPTPEGAEQLAALLQTLNTRRQFDYDAPAADSIVTNHVLLRDNSDTFGVMSRASLSWSSIFSTITSLIEDTCDAAFRWIAQLSIMTK